jgi:hypothetical protein
MEEIIFFSVLLFLAILFLPQSWFGFGDTKSTSHGSLIPEDSVLRRHFISQLRNEIELELFPRPSNYSLQRPYDALVKARLERRLKSFNA